MLLTFKKRFEPYLLDGSKQHTIRAYRKNPAKVGETCYCYGDARQKTMHLIGAWPCVKVEDIRIARLLRARTIIGERIGGTWNQRNYGIWVCQIPLSVDECNALAWRDGFRETGVNGAFDEMISWWMNVHGLPFQGQIIHWKSGQPATDTAVAGAASNPNLPRGEV